MSKPLTPNPGILDIAPYVGGQSALKNTDTVIKLSSNEGALGASPDAVEAIKALAPDIYRYPDGGAIRLRNAIASVEGLDAERIICGAGSDELLSLLAYAYASPGDEIIHTAHGFLMYPICAKAVGASPIAVAETSLRADVDKILAAVTEKTRIVYLANPNNPTGSYVTAQELEYLRTRLPASVMLVLDGAYAEYVTAPDYEAGARLVDANPGNTVMTRTFSKIYALGGLRLGWAYGGAPVIDVLNRIRGPFNVSSAALAAGEAAIMDGEFTKKVRDHTIHWRAQTAEIVGGLGYKVAPSVCNFILVEFPDEQGCDAEAADTFLKSKGIIVRRMNAYGLPRHLRITIGNADEMAALTDALQAFHSSR